MSVVALVAAVVADELVGRAEVRPGARARSAAANRPAAGGRATARAPRRRRRCARAPRTRTRGRSVGRRRRRARSTISPRPSAAMPLAPRPRGTIVELDAGVVVVLRRATSRARLRRRRSRAPSSAARSRSPWRIASKRSHALVVSVGRTAPAVRASVAGESAVGIARGAGRAANRQAVAVQQRQRDRGADDPVARLDLACAIPRRARS